MTESSADRNDTGLQEAGADPSTEEAAPTGVGEGTGATEPGADQGEPAAGADGREPGSEEVRSSGAGDGTDGVTADDGAVLREEFDALNDRHLRLVAEFNNYRRRNDQERLTAWSRAQADLVEGFLDVLDDLHRVADLDLSNATVEAIMEGIDLVERKFIRALGDASVEMVDPTGQPFDPEVMEAMMRVPSEDEAQIDTVAQCFQKGYSLKGILVRPARVSVYTQG